MTKDEANAVLKMKPEELLSLALVDAHAMENLIAQRDDALARIERADGEKALVVKQLADAQAMCDLLGGTEAGQRLAKEKKLAELRTQKDTAIQAQTAAEAEIAKLEKEP